MNPDIVTALAGLGGAVIGAAASTGTAWVTLRRQSQDAIKARRYEIGRLAAEEALSELIQLQQFLATVVVPSGRPAEDPWEGTALDRLRRAALSIARIPGKELPARIQIPLDLAKAYRYAGPRHALWVRWMRVMVEDMITVLLEYVREEDPPPLSAPVAKHQQTYIRRREEEQRRYERLEREAFEDRDPDFEPDDAP
ncbi:hypothetical protein [Streptomyces sp. NPDC017524]|uniref:hypothetical protein n=1 Tax=Streptomyces sp. NPDC017524 TaxID=3364999 RepID=UPI0037BACF46